MTVEVPTEMAGYLMAYFHTELEEDGEQVRFAVSVDLCPNAWTVLAAGRPVLPSVPSTAASTSPSTGLGTGGARDPFLVRDERAGRFFVLATDLRTWPDHDSAWPRSMRHGSRSILVWESADLITWSEPRLVEVAPPQAGNAWAPKAFWSEEKGCWLVFWASALFSDGQDRSAGSHQRILVAETVDFHTFSPARVHLDPGHDVIDLTFIQEEDAWYRFSANAHTPGGSPDLGNHIFMERGPSLESADYAGWCIDIGKPQLQRGEGPAVAPALDGSGHYLLIDEFLLRGYQLFTTESLASGQWRHLPGAQMPDGARHGSLMPITADERDRLLAALG